MIDKIDALVYTDNIHKLVNIRYLCIWSENMQKVDRGTAGEWMDRKEKESQNLE